MTITVLPGPGGWPEDDPPPPPGPPLIELSGLRLPATPANPPHALDLIVRRGEMVMLTGQPRSGRSALLHVLGLLDRPAAGSYWLNGIDTSKLRDRDRAALRGREIGIVLQRKMVLPTRSVLDNVMLPLRYSGLPRRRRLAAAIESLDQVGLADAARLMAWQLSVDELALCAVARALATKPSLVLCDEPTAGLEHSAATQVIGVLARLHREGGTVLVATADQLVAAYSGRSVSLDQSVGPWSATPLSVTHQLGLPIADSPAEPTQRPPGGTTPQIPSQPAP